MIAGEILAKISANNLWDYQDDSPQVFFCTTWWKYHWTSLLSHIFFADHVRCTRVCTLFTAVCYSVQRCSLSHHAPLWVEAWGPTPLFLPGRGIRLEGGAHLRGRTRQKGRPTHSPTLGQCWIRTPSINLVLIWEVLRQHRLISILLFSKNGRSHRIPLSHIILWS